MKKEKVILGHLPEFDVIVELMKKGYTQSQIAQKYGVSRQSVNNRLKRAIKKD